MRICFLAPSNSTHTKKWCGYFVSQGHEVHVVSFCNEQIEGVQVHWVSTSAATDGGDAQKLLYLTKAGRVRKIVKQIAPDVINAHYATSYGTVAALAGLKNYALSVWGSDIYEFPGRSPLHRAMLQFSLARAKYLFSTSQAMADEAGNYTKKKFAITPFGVDLELFHPAKRNRADDGSFVVGTIKGLAPAYGIDNLLRAVATVRKEKPQIPIQVRIAGKGPNEQEYQALARELGIDDITTWLGFIPQQLAAQEWANMDLAIICSNAESFGVSAVEAQASGIPVIISDIPGLMEATQPGSSSVVVPQGDVAAIADTIIKLYDDLGGREQMGKNGRRFVEEHYEYNSCFRAIEALYAQMIRN